MSKPVPPRLTFPASQRVTVTGLSAATGYELTPRQTAVPALARERGNPIARVIVGTPDGLIVAPVDEVTRLEGLTSFWVTFLDDAPGDEAGRMSFELREVRAPLPKKKKHR